MRKLLYVGHKFHIRTGSTQFLIDILHKNFDVHFFAVDPDDELVRNSIIDVASYDIVLIFQMDYLAPIFIAQGKVTIVVPMLDGSEAMPPIHWEFSNQARYLAFSRKLHANIRRSGGDSLLLKYFPEPVPFKDVAKFSSLTAFFWQRRPDHGLDIEFVVRLVSNNASTLYFHDAPDIGVSSGDRLAARLQNEYNIKINRSEWFKNKAEYLKALAKANIFVAPRLTEGIGMGFLEAMSRGMVVLANNAGTHNEYISNWVNGILIDKTLVGLPELQLEAMSDIGARARETVSVGRKTWNESIPNLLDYIETAPKPDSYGVDPQVLAEQLPKAYYAGYPAYTDYLRRNAAKVRSLSPSLADFRARRLLRKTSGVPVSGDSPDLPQSLMSFARGAARKYLVTGWSED